MKHRRGIAAMVVVIIVIAVVALMMSAFMAYEMSKMDPAGSQDEILQNLTTAVQEAQTQLDQVSTRLTEYLNTTEGGKDGDVENTDTEGDTVGTNTVDLNAQEASPPEGNADATPKTETEVSTDTGDTEAGTATETTPTTETGRVDNEGNVVSDPAGVTVIPPEGNPTSTSPEGQTSLDAPLSGANDNN